MTRFGSSVRAHIVNHRNSLNYNISAELAREVASAEFGTARVRQAEISLALGECPLPAPFEGPGPLFRKQKHFLKTAPKPLKAAPKPLKAGQPVWYTPGWGRYSQNVMFLRVYSSVRVATRTRAPIKCSTIVKSTLLGSLKPRLYRHFLNGIVPR